MAIRKSADWLLVRVGDEMMMMNTAKGMHFGLNAVGARIWDLLDREPDTDAICAQLLAEFEVDEALCRADLDAFLAELEAHEAITRDVPQNG